MIITVFESFLWNWKYDYKFHKILICLQCRYKYSITIWYDKIPAVIKYKVRLISHLLSCKPLNPHIFYELMKTCFLRYRNINYHDVINLLYWIDTCTVVLPVSNQFDVSSCIRISWMKLISFIVAFQIIVICFDSKCNQNLEMFINKQRDNK